MVCIRLRLDGYEKLDYLLYDIAAGNVKPEDGYELEIYDLGQYIYRAKVERRNRSGNIMEVRETLVTTRAVVVAEWVRDGRKWRVWLCFEPRSTTDCQCDCYCDE